MEKYLGENLNNARHDDGSLFVKNAEGEDILFLDGRERENPAARCAVKPGRYVLTRTDGSGPGDVAYYGHPE